MTSNARDDTYNMFLAMLTDTFPRRVAINLEDAALFLTEQVGMATSQEMARVYAKSGRLIPGLRKSAAGTWLFPLPALARGLAEGFLASPEPAPEPVVFRARAATQAPVAPVTRGGRRRRSTLSFAVVDGWLLDDSIGEPKGWRWKIPGVGNLDVDSPSCENLSRRDRHQRARAAAAWEQLDAVLLLLSKKREAAAQLALVAAAPAADTDIGRFRS